MAIVDLFARLVSGPAARVVEAPVRELVDEIRTRKRLDKPMTENECLFFFV